MCCVIIGRGVLSRPTWFPMTIRLKRIEERVSVKSNFLIIGMVPIFLSLIVTSCANQNELNSSLDVKDKQQVVLSRSYLEDDLLATSGEVSTAGDEVVAEAVNAYVPTRLAGPSIEALKPIQWPSADERKINVISDQFSSIGDLKMAADRMSVKDFVHYIFGELLNVNYVLGQTLISASQDAEGITLSLSNSLSPRALFILVSEILSNRGIDITFDNETFYIHLREETSSKAEVIIAIGGQPSDVPNTVNTIQQVVPLQYGIKISTERVLRSLVDAKITPDFDQSVVFVEGKKKSILRALELIELLDTPATRSKFVGLIKLNFLTPDDFTRDVSVLLNNEGIDVSVSSPNRKNVVLVPLRQIGAVAIFSVSDVLLNRVLYWASVIDVPSQGSSAQYFVYKPKFSSAVDLGESVGALLGNGVVNQVSNNNADGDRQARETGNAPAKTRVIGNGDDGVRMVVDQRANALIFFTTGGRYRALMPLLTQLDTLPSQVMLDMTIAEVSLKDEFKYGFEWAVSRGEVNLLTQGAFGVSNIGSLGLIIQGNEGPLNANFLNSNSLVNVLSNPTLLVRDGTSASISVGSDISVVGQTTQDPINGERQTTSSEYRKTGVDVTVTPTVNGQGIVSMVIDQTISNSLPSSSGSSGNPDIFERTIATEVLAKSGQTVMLAGLISENFSTGAVGAPWLSHVPLLGNLFKSESDSGNRTELIMLITPRVIVNLDEWELIKEDFKDGLKYMRLSE